MELENFGITNRFWPFKDEDIKYTNSSLNGFIMINNYKYEVYI